MKLEEIKVIIEALQQFIDNQPDVDEPDPRDVRITAIAQQLLDQHELTFIRLLGD